MIDLRRYIRPGDVILVGQGTGEPRALVEALIAQRHRLGGVTVFVGSSYSGLFRPEHADALSFTGYGGVGETAVLTKAGVLEVRPIHFGTIAQLIATGQLRFDVVMAQLSSPDTHGVHSLGLVTDFMRTAISATRVTLAEVNPLVPYTQGDTLVRNAELTAVVHDDRPLIEVPRRPPLAQDLAIAEHIAAIIPDGATLQVGVGATPDAALAKLHNARDLGVHSGIMTDALCELIEAGVVTNARKEIDTGVTVTGLLFGGNRLFRWADNNPALLMREVSYTHHPGVLASFGSMFAINSAVEVDLTGQINSEVANGRYVGTVGGQGSFARAGISCAAGRSIVALHSTALGATVSKIVPMLANGVVSTARADADLIVTEHGVADLRGRSVTERARRLIAIADPRHREDLERHLHGPA